MYSSEQLDSAGQMGRAEQVVAKPGLYDGSCAIEAGAKSRRGSAFRIQLGVTDWRYGT
jgi:hypothetical protein